MRGSYYSLIHDDIDSSLHNLKESMVGWKNSSFQRRKRQYCALPFVLCYNGETYPVISFNCTSWLSSQDGSGHKILLYDEDDHSISLAHRLLGLTWGCSQYNRSEPVEINQDPGEALQEALHDDVKEPEPVPNKLPTFVIENHMHYEIARSECPIATIGLNECDRVSMLDCYHVFDSASIHAWMRIKAECPVCKGKSQIIHTLSVPESLRPPAPAPMIEPAQPAPKKLPKPGIAPAAPKKLPKPGIAPSPPK
jgi:hypothetical protein